MYGRFALLSFVVKCDLFSVYWSWKRNFAVLSTMLPSVRYTLGLKVVSLFSSKFERLFIDSIFVRCLDNVLLFKWCPNWQNLKERNRTILLTNWRRNYGRRFRWCRLAFENSIVHSGGNTLYIFKHTRTTHTHTHQKRKRTDAQRAHMRLISRTYAGRSHLGQIFELFGTQQQPQHNAMCGLVAAVQQHVRLAACSRDMFRESS